MIRPLRAIKRVLWIALAPIRRPIASRFHAAIVHGTSASIRSDLHPHVGELLQGVAIARREVGTYRNEVNLCLDALVREVTRLQDEVSELRGVVAELADRPARLSVLDARSESA